MERGSCSVLLHANLDMASLINNNVYSSKTSRSLQHEKQISYSPNEFKSCSGHNNSSVDPCGREESYFFKYSCIIPDRIVEDQRIVG